MVTSLGFLKQASKIERELAELSCARTLRKLEPYAGYPEVAKVIDYINNYRTDIPESHMVFGFIEAIEKEKKKQDEVKSVVRERLSKKGLLSEKQKAEMEEERKQAEKKRKDISREEDDEIKREIEQCVKNAEKMEILMAELEKSCDTAWEFFNKNANNIGRVCKPYKVVAIRNLLSGLKGNLRALKVR